MSGQTNGGVFNPRNLQLFTYSFNNPINLFDPDGFAPESVWEGVKQIYHGITNIQKQYRKLAKTRSYLANAVADTALTRLSAGGAVNKVGGGRVVTGVIKTTESIAVTSKILPRFNINKLSPEMQQSFNRTHNRLLEGGMRPSAKAIRSNWGKTFQNNKGHLPDLGRGGYKEFKIAGPSNARNDNVFRMVVGKNGKAYYSNTHYGTNPNAKGKAFYEVGQFSKKQTQQIFRNNAGK